MAEAAQKVAGFVDPATKHGGGKTPRLVGWQGFLVRVPEAWDLTGFSGDFDSGYFRVDDGEEMGLEVKWGTEPAKAKDEPDVTVRRESYFRSLKQTAKKKRLDLQARDVETYKPVLRPDRTATGFTWTGDRKAIGAIWHCRTTRRTVIAQVLGERTGRGGLIGIAEAVLGSLESHGPDAKWQTWALYDLHTEIPSEYRLASQQLMNVYLRLSFLAHKTARLSVEQWSAANVARRDAYLDGWLQANAKGELKEARVGAVEETEARGHAAIALGGGLGLGTPMINAVKQAARFERPATRFSGRAWECPVSNHIYLVEALRPAKYDDIVEAVARRTVCHRDEENA